jgi:polyhydroxyalkanoate synthesis regulator phasin
MTLEHLAQCGKPWAQERAQVALDMQAMFAYGEMSKEEFVELTQDLIRADQLNKDADDVETKAMLETAIKQLVSIVGGMI